MTIAELVHLSETLAEVRGILGYISATQVEKKEEDEFEYKSRVGVFDMTVKELCRAHNAIIEEIDEVLKEA